MFQQRPQPQIQPDALCQLRHCPGLSIMLDLGAFDVKSISPEQKNIVKAAGEMLDLPSGLPPAIGFISGSLAGVISDDIEEGPLEDWHLVVAALDGDSIFERNKAIKSLQREMRVFEYSENTKAASEPELLLKATRESWAIRNPRMPQRAMFWGFISGNLIQEEASPPGRLYVASRVSPEFET